MYSSSYSLKVQPGYYSKKEFESYLTKNIYQNQITELRDNFSDHLNRVELNSNQIRFDQFDFANFDLTDLLINLRKDFFLSQKKSFFFFGHDNTAC